MSDFSTRAVHITLARELTEALEQLRSPLENVRGIGLARVTRVRNALTEEKREPPIQLRKFALVQISGRPPDRSIESSYLNREPEPDPVCLAEQTEGDDAG